MEDATAEDERTQELDMVTAIYPEITRDNFCPFKASLSLPVSPVTPIRALFLPSNTDPEFASRLSATVAPARRGGAGGGGGGGDGGGGRNGDRGGPETRINRDKDDRIGNGNITALDHEAYSLSYLPPLYLEIELPDGYPSEKPPVFSISTQLDWLPISHTNRLVQDGKTLWEQSGKDLVVYSFIDHLQLAAEQGFGISHGPNGVVIFPRHLEVPLLDFDINAKRQKFEQETFQCGICLEPKKGLICHRMQDCGHVSCVSCLQDFYGMCITEGAIDKVKCTAPGCEKESDTSDTQKRRKDRTLVPGELLQIPLPLSTVRRYAQLKRKRKMELDKSTVYCPRQWCQGAARSKRHPKPTDILNDDSGDDDDDDADDDDEPSVGAFGQDDEDLSKLPPIEERVAVCEDCSFAFCSVCKKSWHGPVAFCAPTRRIREISAEEKASEDYMETYTTRCPTCLARCQKSSGCNHMQCFKCSTHFCYLCSAWLTPNNPYTHFNRPGTPCFQRLWVLEWGDGAEIVRDILPEE
ncbi:translation termination inhibitor protein itt1 [Myotisia sp. PD_48]|nr:translation termination inhibitor protein itt1 [Myotisia sp. PD_48]